MRDGLITKYSSFLSPQLDYLVTCNFSEGLQRDGAIVAHGGNPLIDAPFTGFPLFRFSLYLSFHLCS